MKPQYDNKILSSFLLYLDNKILSKGEAFSNHSGLFYPIESFYDGYYVYASPFKQLVYDSSVSGSNQISGVFVNGSFVKPGQGDLVAINPNQGAVYFNTDQASNTISGNYAVKDFNILITDENEEKLLFENKYFLRPKTSQNVTGISTESLTFPIIYIKINSAEHKPFALGGLDEASTNIRAIILADSAFLLDAACSIMRDCKDDRFTILENSNLPMNVFGYTGNFNYTGVNTNKIPLIWSVSVNKILPSRGDLKNLNANVLCAFADFEISDLKTHK